MNKVTLVGRLTHDPDYRLANSGTGVCRFSLAIRKRNGESDFIACTAFGKTAELVGQYVTKGNRLAVAGHIQSGQYTDSNGAKKYTTQVIVDEIEFLENRQVQVIKQEPTFTEYVNTIEPKAEQMGFVEVEDKGLPF